MTVFGTKSISSLPRFSRTLWFVAAFCTMCMALHDAVAQQQDPPRYRVSRAMDAESGILPQNSIQAMLQTNDGYLWFGTQEGLVRFNGVTSRIYSSENSSLPSSLITALAEDSSGRLWVGTDRGLACMEGDSFKTWSTTQGLVNNTIIRLVFTPEQKLWIGTLRGLQAHDGTKLLDAVNTQDRINALELDSHGQLWVATPRGISIVGADGVVHPAPLDTLNTGDAGARHVATLPVFAIVAGPGGRLYCNILDTGIVVLEREQSGLYRSAGHASVIGVRCIMEDGPAVWYGSDGKALCRMMNNAPEFFTTADGMSSNSILTLLKDREGNVWVGTRDAGVICLSPERISAMGIPEGLPFDYVSCMLPASDGTVWIGTGGGGLAEYTPKKKLIVHNAHTDLPGNYIRVLYEDRAKTIWVGILNGGLYVRSASGSTRLYNWSTGFRWGTPNAVAEDDSAGVLVATNAGIFRCVNGAFIPYNRPGSPSGSVIYFLRNDGHNLWAASRDGRLFVLTGDSVREVMHDVRVMDLYRDAMGIVWVSTLEGLRLIGPDLSVMGKVIESDGLFDNSIFSILEDSAGRCWMSSNKGIFYLRKKDLMEKAMGKSVSLVPVSFGKADGMRSRECNGGLQYEGVRFPDGRFAFATVKGVAIVDPRSVHSGAPPPRVVIEALISGAGQFPGREHPVLEPGDGNLQFQYAALVYGKPGQVRYFYLLEGYDKNWVDAGNRREAFYTHLSPGTYHFRVRALSADGLKSLDDAVMTLRLAPFFYQSPLFITLALIGFAASLAGSYRLYRGYRDRGIAAERLRSQLAVAQLAMLRSQLKPHFLFNTLNTIHVYIRDNPAVAEKMVVQLGDLLRTALELHEAQYVPLRKEMEFITAYLTIQQIRFEDQLTCSIENDPANLEAAVPPLLLQPMVENAIAHGFANKLGDWQLGIRIVREADRLRIEVSDNGTGLEHGTVDREGVGIANTRSRLQYLYGDQAQFDIRNHPDGPGVQVSIVLPFRISSNGVSHTAHLQEGH